jgi:hypothetical protein
MREEKYVTLNYISGKVLTIVLVLLNDNHKSFPLRMSYT